ncbi:hypothetical protein MNBD_ALPHA09-1253 [hydrothermal vent metagenome]|uniref:DUF5666 domain-containing protein n=1 Tax=hydrothermal vent metagenome TaxID=652676 RepID=A0A3B0TF27_9ZZZZ
MIRKLLGTAAIIAVLSFPALAEEASGVVASFDEATRALMLDSGEIFVLAEGLDTASIVTGVKVVLDYDVDGDKNVVKQIVVE